ncbi:hypothetical protein E2C01_064127 [Portunus trituberculatus]|uniref:Uncharacterized protein n=1 Tax=Portunus trituberculatus TaxID=210409 RepID=A0A5B7HK05_PORTR|nr:hypothetical protein [Portunus trituberculatus]
MLSRSPFAFLIYRHLEAAVVSLSVALATSLASGLQGCIVLNDGASPLRKGRATATFAPICWMENAES